MKSLLLLLLGCALIPLSLPAQTFEGKVTMAIKTSESADKVPLIRYTIKAGFMRMDSTMGSHQSSMIFDLKNRQMIILMPQQSMYMVQPMPAAGSAAAATDAESRPDAKFETTGDTATILGYTCRKYLVTTTGNAVEIWATDQLGSFGGFNLGGNSGGRSNIFQGWGSAFQGKNFFPMRISGSHGGQSFSMEVTAVEKQAVPDSEFAPPDGWRKFDMGNFMQGVGAGGFQR
jgi:hypothetical protein